MVFYDLTMVFLWFSTVFCIFHQTQPRLPVVQDDGVSTAATSATRAPSARFNLFIQGAAMATGRIQSQKYGQLLLINLIMQCMYKYYTYLYI